MQNILKVLLGNKSKPHRNVGRPTLSTREGYQYLRNFPLRKGYQYLRALSCGEGRARLFNTLFLKLSFNILITISIISFTPTFAKNETPIAKTEVDSLKRSEEKYWYADKPLTEKKKENPKPKTPTESKFDPKIFESIGVFFKIIVWGILGAAVLFAIYVIFNNLKDFKFKTNTKVTAISKEITETINIKDLETVDFGSQIEKCIKEENYRLATRYYYLWVVKTLHEANLITFNIDKTNQDYTKELSKKSIFPKERLSHFMQCTNYYEYLWFGNFNVSETSFFSIENTFKAFINQKS